MESVNVVTLISFATTAVVISLACTFIPNFRVWFAKQTSEAKSLAHLLVLTGMAILAGVLSFTGVYPFVTPDKAGIIQLVVLWIGALVTNQTTYEFSPQPEDVRLAKSLR